MLTLGIIGHGFVGKAMHKAFEHNADVIIVDPKESDMTVERLANHEPDAIFVCLPAPTLDDGSVDAALIYDVFARLSAKKYTGLVVVKSTLPPDIVQDLFDSFCVKQDGVSALRYIYSPEFLRESMWEYDSLHPGRLIFAGNYTDCRQLEQIYRRHSHIMTGTRYMFTDYKTASFLKYSINSFLATKVVFMNQLKALYEDINNGPSQPETWESFTEMMTTDHRIGSSHMSVPGSDGKYGYGGTCFPKDVKAMNGFDANGRMTVAREAELANTQIRLGHK
jgi:UDPglucose 6-dehydrogenase